MSIAASTRGVVQGTGMAVPERIMTNAELEKIVDTTDEWITTRSGIKERHVCAPGEHTRDLAAAAGRKAMEDAGVDPAEVDVVIVSTATPDHLLPSTACEAQPLLGCHQAACFDVSAACAGWLYALTIADGLLCTRLYDKVLVIGAEKMSAIIDYTDRATCVLFGDGAGAALIGPPGSGSGGSGILSSHMQTDGRQAQMLWRPAGGAEMPSTEATRTERLEFVKQEGREVFKSAVLAMEESSRIALDRARLTMDQIDLVIPHQANIRIIHAVGSRLEVPDEKVYVNIDRYGNTSSASIPICLAEACAEGRVGPGANILMTAFGGGFAWGSVVLRL
jgi:3-oxoacyl-[acyl-carrier-protein] synthase III